MACSVCRAKNETIRALKDTIAAKDQAILVMADQIDAYRATSGLSPTPVFPSFAPERSPDKLWLDDDEEELIAQVEAGVISPEHFEQGLAALQAQNQTLKVVR